MCIRDSLEPDQMTLLTIEKGEIIGSSNDKTFQWLGIQYGSIPNSSYRWKKASEREAWEGTFEALEFGNTCIQRGSLINMTKRRNWGEIIGSEDCLYLNVWSPLDALDSSSSKIPVMVWIHGGSNVSGNSDFYDPSRNCWTLDVCKFVLIFIIICFFCYYTSSPDIKKSVDAVRYSDFLFRALRFKKSVWPVRCSDPFLKLAMS